MLIQKIKEYIKKYDLQTLCNMSWINRRVILSLLKWDHRKYRKTTLDILYDFFKLKHDKFYFENLKKWYPKTESLLWTLIRFKRVRRNIELEKLAKQIKMDSRALKRLESGDALPYYNNWSIQHVLDVLEFTKEEREIVENYIKIMRKTEKLVKKYEI